MSHKLTSKQRRAIYLMVKGLTNIEIAAQLKMRRETLSRWKKKPEFAKKFDQVMEEFRLGMQHRLANLIDASITTVRSELSYSNDPKRIQTALGVLKLLGIDRILPPNDPNVPQTITAGDQENILSNSMRSTESTSSIVVPTPSACSEVTPKLLIPQGTMPP